MWYRFVKFFTYILKLVIFVIKALLISSLINLYYIQNVSKLLLLNNLVITRNTKKC